MKHMDVMEKHDVYDGIWWKTYFKTIDPLCVEAYLQQGGFEWYLRECSPLSCQSVA